MHKQLGISHSNVRNLCVADKPLPCFCDTNSAPLFFLATTGPVCVKACRQGDIRAHKFSVTISQFFSLAKPKKRVHPSITSCATVCGYISACNRFTFPVTGCEILGVEIDPNATPIQEHPFQGPTAFILGNEVQSLVVHTMSSFLFIFNIHYAGHLV